MKRISEKNNYGNVRKRAERALKAAASNVGMDVLERLYRSAREDYISTSDICKGNSPDSDRLPYKSVLKILKELEELGMVEKRDTGYRMTERGRKFYEILRRMVE